MYYFRLKCIYVMCYCSLMKIFTRDYRMEGALPASYTKYFQGLRCCVLDIETSGLSRDSSKLILMGLLTETESGVRVTQFLAENHYEEHKVLEATMQFLKSENIGYFTTYNGASFDVPFINKRLEAAFMDDHLSLYDLDLFRFIKCATDLKNRIGSLRQVAVENYYGILEDRQDSITGRESITMFDEYSITGNTTLEKIILTHNREDVLHLYRLLHLVLADVDKDGYMDTGMSKYGFPILDGKLSVRACVKKPKGAAGSVLRITGEQLKDPFSAAFFPDIDFPITAEFKADAAAFEIEIPIEKAPDIAEGSCPYYLDAGSLGLDVSDEPDCVNDYLILSPGGINLAARLITEKIVEMSNRQSY